jgi:hypothetical protein
MADQTRVVYQVRSSAERDLKTRDPPLRKHTVRRSHKELMTFTKIILYSLYKYEVKCFRDGLWRFDSRQGNQFLTKSRPVMTPIQHVTY